MLNHILEIIIAFEIGAISGLLVAQWRTWQEIHKLQKEASTVNEGRTDPIVCPECEDGLFKIDRHIAWNGHVTITVTCRECGSEFTPEQIASEGLQPRD